MLPALLINLGLMTNIDDESIRSLVAMEMLLSGNFVVPTLNGEVYLNKPPLFNWILLVWFKVFGNFEELTARFQTVLALLGYAATVVWSFKKPLGIHLALLSALCLITCGRVLFWDSLLSLIDITFSWVIFGLFMTSLVLEQKQSIQMDISFTLFSNGHSFPAEGVARTCIPRRNAAFGCPIETKLAPFAFHLTWRGYCIIHSARRWLLFGLPSNIFHRQYFVRSF